MLGYSIYPLLVPCTSILPYDPITAAMSGSTSEGTRDSGRLLRQDNITADRLSRKQVDFEGDGKVLLSRLGDKIHATSAFCTHYGAPLVKGVLTADGRVVWCADSPISRAAQD